MDKRARLGQLAEEIKALNFAEYFKGAAGYAAPAKYHHVREFHQGAYDSDHACPWSKTAHNAEAQVVIVAQDWSSSERLSGPLDSEVARLGYDKKLATNINLHRLLRQHLQLEFSQTYSINVFPFVKMGNMSASIPARHVEKTARDFALKAIEIVSPRLVICLGKLTFNAMRKASGLRPSASLDDAVRQPFLRGGTLVVAVAHTGRLGTNSRNRQNRMQVEEDWASLTKFLP